MREDWKIMRLGDIASYINGFAFKPEDWSDKGLPIIRIQNLTENNSSFHYCQRKDIPSKYLVQKGDILISWSATLGVFEWILENALLNQHIFKVVFDKIEINKQYFKYAIHMSIDEMSRHTNGATMKHIRKGDFDNISIPVPSLSEQERIVALLDDQFARIDALKANAASQLQAAKDLFQSAIKEVFEANRNWKYKSFEDCLQKVPKQKAVKSKDYLKNGLFPIVSQESDLISGYTDDENILYKHEKPVIIFGDHTKNIKYIDFNFVVGADGVHILSVKDDILPKFFYYELCSIKLRNLGYARHYKLLKEKEIGYPKLTEQERIAARLDAISEKVKALQANYDQTITLCNDLKQALLKSIFA